MHRAWESGIIDRAGRGEAGWLDDLIAMDTPEARQKAQGGTVEDWATESLLAAREAYQDPATGQRIKPGAKLADSYQVREPPVVNRRLDQPGVRLAMVLNEALIREALVVSTRPIRRSTRSRRRRGRARRPPRRRATAT
jgi:nuclease S1